MQTTINPAGQPLGIAGQKSDNMEGTDVISMFNADTVSIPFGAAVVQGAGNPQNAMMPHAIADTVVGVSLFGFNHVHGGSVQGGVNVGTGDLDAVGQVPGAGLQVMRRGRVWVTVEEAVNPGDRAYVRALPNVGAGFPNVGTWRKTADGTNTIDVRRVAVYRSTAAAGGLAELEVTFTIHPTI